MPTWNNVNSGLWTDGANWTGGVPNAAGALADMVVVGGTGATVATFTENTTVTVGTLNVTSTGARDVILQGSLADSGSGVATLSFDPGFAGSGTARVNVTTAVGGGEFEISSFGGLRVQINADTEFNVVNAGTTARINAPIIGSGILAKLGAGTLFLGSASTTFSGVINIEGGTLSGLNGGVFGTANMTLSNNAILRTSGTLTNNIGTVTGTTGVAGSGQIMAQTGTTLTITGNFGHKGGGVLTLGNTVDNGTIAIASTAADVSGAGSIRLNGSTIRFDNAYSAGNVFYGSNLTGTELVNGAILDGRGFQMRVTNLDLDAGTIRSSTGALNLLVSDTLVSANAQTGTIEGTASVDRVEIDATNDWSFAGTTFSNWSSNDVIQIDGSANANNLTGSTMNDTFNSVGGNDTLIGNGGVDSFFAGDDDDLIVLNAQNSGSFLNGGLGTDTLRVTGGSISLGSMTGMEAIELQNGATLALSNSQFFSLPSTAAISGTGTISVTLFSNQNALTNNFAVAGGSNITFNIQAAGSNETIVIHPDAIGIISDGGGVDTFTGGNRGDTFNLFGGTDTVTGGAGNDLFALASGASGSFLNGGADTDTLRVTSGSVTLGSVTGFEAIDLAAGTTLTVTGSHFKTGFASNTVLSGSGSLVIDMSAANPVFSITGIIVAGGSSVGVTINGTSGLDQIKGIINWANTINGGDGVDQIRGGNLGDTINGGLGNDKIYGAGGADVLTGGVGNDQFRYVFASDSGLGAAADLITDFETAGDRLNFQLMDADIVAAGDQAFSFVGNAAFANTGIGQIRYQDSGANLLVQIDSDGNGFADMEVVLQGQAGQTLTEANFIL